MNILFITLGVGFLITSFLIMIACVDSADMQLWIGYMSILGIIFLCLAIHLETKQYYEQRIPNLEQQMREYEKEQLRDRLEELENVEIEED